VKIIEAMKRVKGNKEKIIDLQAKIGQHCANLNFETQLYGTDGQTEDKIKEWAQACGDLTQDNVKLLTAISRTNLATAVTINLGGKGVTKNIAEWIWRRREYAAIDLATWSKIGDKGLREGTTKSSTGEDMKITIVRHYDPVVRDTMIAMYKSEANEIDSTLEVINAITDLLE